MKKRGRREKGRGKEERGEEASGRGMGTQQGRKMEEWTLLNMIEKTHMKEGERRGKNRERNGRKNSNE